jgi:hypothetical protein
MRYFNHEADWAASSIQCTSVTKHNSSDTFSRYIISDLLITVKNRNVRTILFEYSRIMKKVCEGAEAVLHAFLSLHHMKFRGSIRSGQPASFEGGPIWCYVANCVGPRHYKRWETSQPFSRYSNNYLLDSSTRYRWLHITGSLHNSNICTEQGQPDVTIWTAAANWKINGSDTVTMEC